MVLKQETLMPMALPEWEDKNKLVMAVNRLQNYALMFSDNCFVKMFVNPHSV